jgi:hypothetical protein
MNNWCICWFFTRSFTGDLNFQRADCATSLYKSFSGKGLMNSSFLYFSLSQSDLYLPTYLPTHCRCRGLLLHLITLSDKHIHTHTHAHSVGPLWTRYRPVAETSTWQHTTLKTDKQTCPAMGFEPAIPASQRPQTHALDSDSGVPRGVGGSTPPPPRNYEVLTKLCRIPSSGGDTSVTTWSEYGFHSFANWVEPLTRGYRPQSPVLSALCPQLNLLNPPEKIHGYATGQRGQWIDSRVSNDGSSAFCWIMKYQEFDECRRGLLEDTSALFWSE